MSVSLSELGPPTPSPASECCLPLGPKGGEQRATIFCGWEGGCPNSDDWIESLAPHSDSFGNFLRRLASVSIGLYLALWFYLREYRNITSTENIEKRIRIDTISWLCTAERLEQNLRFTREGLGFTANYSTVYACEEAFLHCRRDTNAFHYGKEMTLTL